MAPRTLVAAGRRVEIAPRKMTFLEAMHTCNIKGKTIVPNRFYNDLFLKKAPLAEEISKARPFYTGTYGVIGYFGWPLEKQQRTEATYFGNRKSLIIETEGAPANVMLCCDQGFGKDGAPNLQFFDAKTDNPILTHEGMLESAEVILRFNGNTYSFKFSDRHGSQFPFIFLEHFDAATLELEDTDHGNTYISIPRCATGALIERGRNIYVAHTWITTYFRNLVHLKTEWDNSDGLSVMTEDMVA
jgi:hypothetical protein